MVGDSFEADIVGAINMGMKNILIDHGYTAKECLERADTVIKNIGELIDIIHRQ